MNDRKCRKCSERIPVKIKIDGKERNLKNRKFCLKCSPFGKHNTRTDIDKPKIKGKTYADWSTDTRKKYAQKLLQRARGRKLKLIELSGGSCEICGYNKCLRALTFHHVNPEEKLFGLCANNLWSTNWEKILEEHSKCQLLCIRCHMEIEDRSSPAESCTQFLGLSETIGVEPITSSKDDVLPVKLCP